MYTLKEVLNRNPIQISGAILGVVNFCIIMGWISLTGDQVAGLNVAMVGLLGLFVTTKTTNTTRLDELNDDAGEVTLGTIALVLECIFFVVAICWFVDNAGWLD